MLLCCLMHPKIRLMLVCSNSQDPTLYLLFSQQQNVDVTASPKFGPKGFYWAASFPLSPSSLCGHFAFRRCLKLLIHKSQKRSLALPFSRRSAVTENDPDDFAERFLLPFIALATIDPPREKSEDGVASRHFQ